MIRRICGFFNIYFSYIIIYLYFLYIFQIFFWKTIILLCISNCILPLLPTIKLQLFQHFIIICSCASLWIPFIAILSLVMLFLPSLSYFYLFSLRFTFVYLNNIIRNFTCTITTLNPMILIYLSFQRNVSNTLYWLFKVFSSFI